MTRLSTHILHNPSLLGVNRIDTAQRLKISCINPFCNSSHTCICNSAYSLEFILYRGKFGNVALGTKTMAC